MCILYLTATSGWPSHAKCHAVLGRPVPSLPSFCLFSSLLSDRESKTVEDMASLASFPRFKMAIVVSRKEEEETLFFFYFILFYFFHLVSHQVATDRCLLQADVIGGGLRLAANKQLNWTKPNCFYLMGTFVKSRQVDCCCCCCCKRRQGKKRKKKLRKSPGFYFIFLKLTNEQFRRPF